MLKLDISAAPPSAAEITAERQQALRARWHRRFMTGVLSTLLVILQYLVIMYFSNAMYSFVTEVCLFVLQAHVWILFLTGRRNSAAQLHFLQDTTTGYMKSENVYTMISDNQMCRTYWAAVQKAKRPLILAECVLLSTYRATNTLPKASS